MTAPNPLYQEGYSMTDTTDQQAVTVAQEDREAASKIYALLGFGPCQHIIDGVEDDVGVVQIVAQRSAEVLASVSSASAEPFLAQLRRVNLARYEAWVEGADAGIMFDALELGGEVGELLNVVKKLEREERGWRGSRANPTDFDDECGDVMICLDKLARRRNVDLAAATIAKFNATSEKVGLPHRLSASPEPVPATNQAGEVEGRFWLIVHEPGKVPDRKGSWPRSQLPQIMREFIAARPSAYLTVLTVGADGTPDVQHGPEALQMADGRSMRTGSSHNARTLAAHTASVATQPATSQEVHNG